MVLNERLVTEMNEKSILPESQAGFRRGRGAMDDVYILHHQIEKELLKEGGWVYALFVHLKAAFDTVDRECLWECMERRGLSEKLIVAAREIYREIVTSVRVGGIESEMFWTMKGLRQRCPLSPSLFACYISDIEEMFRGVQAEGIVVGREKVSCLAFADDLVILAKDECGMNEMKKNLQRYFKRKKLEVNVKKTKMMVFRKKGRKGEEKVWPWGDRIIDTVKEFKYLGFKFTTTNTVKAHIRERRVKAMQIMGMVWSIGERIFGHDVRRRMKMSDSLVRSVLMYGVEIWGWKEYAETEAVQEKYLRWMLALRKETPGYIVREECKREKLRVYTGKRAVKYDERLKEREVCRILYECWKEKKRKQGKNITRVDKDIMKDWDTHGWK
ncbi:hypothetical protein Zmor_002262 [Zophobas morio]|uniref:Reverse transcriptase domain-containing protein n=1 Tax=Zophobas morio TaxID=2755281 RepID=A0AA38MTG1_9CUCU|nr:hypothetical protein Zmor_002262 [Zophobas morio]